LARMASPVLDEGFGVVLVLGDIAVDGGLEVDNRSEGAFEPSPGERAEKNVSS
jgi:hypothetical protein